MVASAGRSEIEMGSNPSASGSGLPQVTQGENRGTPQLGSTLRFPHQRESRLVSGGENPDELSNPDHAFLMKHIRTGTVSTYGSGWRRFQRFCEGYRINPQLAPLPLIIKFIWHLYESGVSSSVVGTAVSAISKYHIVDVNTGLTMGQHSFCVYCQESFLATQTSDSKISRNV